MGFSNLDDGADPLDIALGQHIRARRRELHLSQQSLAARVGLTFQQVQKYEKGVNRVSFSRLVAISRALECSVGDLIKGIEKGVPNNATTNSLMSNIRTSGAAELLKAFSAIETPQRRRALLELARELATQEGHPSERIAGRRRS